MARRMKCIGLQKKLPVANVPSHDDLLARVAERLAYLVEDAGSLRFLGFAVGAAFFTDIFES
jgi:hypothetical protein